MKREMETIRPCHAVLLLLNFLNELNFFASCFIKLFLSSLWMVYFIYFFFLSSVGIGELWVMNKAIWVAMLTILLIIAGLGRFCTDNTGNHFLLFIIERAECFWGVLQMAKVGLSKKYSKNCRLRFQNFFDR